MYKCLLVVVFVLLVLTAAMGFRNVVAANASKSSGSVPSLWAQGGPFPPPPPGGGGQQ
jgi:hypothetical protein